MELAPKKPRNGAAPFDNDEDEGEEDDELSYHPQEVSARRDPDYKLSLKRAHADHKFQLAMAHIIEKYSHNFEGIGDEIDLEAGEIVVNNGHVRNMRNEGDIGRGWADDQDDEDEGILLEDLADEYSDDDRHDEGAKERTEDQKEGGDGSDEDVESVVRDQEVVPASNALVLAQGVAPNQLPQGAMLPSLCPNPYTSFSPYGYGPPPMGFGAYPFAFGPSPYGLPPWGMLHSFPAPHLGSPSPPGFSIQCANSNKLALLGKGGGHEFPAQDGRNSIWASGSGYDDQWNRRSTTRVGLRKQIRKTPKKSKERRPTSITDAQEGGGDSGEKSDVENTETTKSAVDCSDEEDDLIPSSSEPSSGQSKSSTEQSTRPMKKPSSASGRKQNATPDAKRTTKKRKRAISDEPKHAAPVKKQQAAVVEVEREPEKDIEEDQTDRRRSGRVRRPVEYMGKISWSQAIGAERRSTQCLSIELQGPSPESRRDFVRIDDDVSDEVDEVDEVPPATESSQHEIEGRAERPAATKWSKDVIPDSQDSATPTSSATQEPPLKLASDASTKAMSSDVDSACVLSDDEAPIILPRRNSTAQKRPNVKYVQELPTPNDSGAELSEPTTEVISKKNRIAKNKTEAKPSHSQPSAGRESATEVQVSNPGPVPNSDEQLKPRKRGRPRKSEVVASPKQPLSKSAVTSIPVSVQPQTTGDLAKDSQGKDVSSAIQDEEHQHIDRDAKRLKKREEETLEPVGSNETTATEDEIVQGQIQPSTKQSTSVQAEKTAKPTDQPLEEPAKFEKENVDPSSRQLVETDQAPNPHAHAPSSTPRKAPLQPHLQGRTSTTNTPSPSSSAPKPHTPRHTSIRTTKAPSSRRSILSLLSDDEDDDELIRDAESAFLKPQTSTGKGTTRKLWKSSAFTTEVYHTPVKKRMVDVISPGSVIKTPGGSIRICGVDGYRCGRDFCFTCL